MTAFRLILKRAQVRLGFMSKLASAWCTCNPTVSLVAKRPLPSISWLDQQFLQSIVRFQTCLFASDLELVVSATGYLVL